MGIRLLIADDEEVVRKGISKYIQLHTDRFETIYLASNGEEASEIIFRYKPEIMIVDVQMPIKNGLEVMNETKKAGIMPDTIILSGYDEFCYAQQAIKFGAKEYLLKPCRSNDILKILENVADKRCGGKVKEEKYAPAGKNSIVECAKRYIQDHYFENISAQVVADKVGISPGYLSTLFTQQLGYGFIDFLNRIRIENACCYLSQNYFKTYEVAYKVGFKDEKYFTKVFHKLIGESPTEYKKTHQEN